MNFLAPLAFLGALIAIPIILLYMLRLRRREVVISSTFLWQQVMQDNEANTPWQKLKRNLLLLLQLIILALLVLTLARPFITVPAVSAGKTVVLLDASASMNATDIDGGTRLDEAKRLALEIVNTLSAGQQMTVIRVADVPEPLISDSTDRARLRQAIQSAQPSTTRADWNAALNLAAAGAQDTEDFTIVIVGDGGLGATEGLPGIAGELRYVPVGTSGDNVTISALATRALPGEAPQLFAQITNYGAVDVEVVFSLRVDGELASSERYTIPAESNQPIVSTAALGEDFSSLEASVSLSVNSAGADYLADDNTAYAVSARSSERRALLMTTGNLYLEQILRSLPGLNAFRGNLETGIPAQPYDLYVFDGWLPDQLPAGDLLIINPPSSTPYFTLGALNQTTTNPRANMEDARTAFVDLSTMSLLQFRELSGTAWADVLAEVDGGPILLSGEIDGRQVTVLPFDLRESNLPLLIAWPVLVNNLVEWFTPQAALTESDGMSIGDSLTLRPPLEADSLRVTLPDGQTRTLDAAASPALIFAETAQPGIYLLEAFAGGEVIQTQQVAVNLFSPLESDIQPVPQGSLQVGQATVAAPDTEELGQRELWPFAAGLALLMLLIEWIVYHRRQRVPTLGRTAADALPPFLRRRRA
ncbi:MAG: VWA domain-containing protein [bacterium]|nr:VWA domain-containing protein [bacterium]